MKRNITTYWILGSLFLLSICNTAWAQTEVKDMAPETYFDFWVGTWDATWDNGDSTIGRGTNNIHKALDGKVIQEDFKITDGGKNTGFTGRSLSVYNPVRKTWHQAWVDNQGGYYNLLGVIDGEKRIFQTTPRRIKNGKLLQQRMVFYDIKNDSFTWDWESSLDGGETWNLNWRIQYTRAKSK